MTSPGARRAWVDGVALWASRLPGWENARAVLAGRAPSVETKSPRPGAELLPPNERRRAPDSVAIALHAALSACQHAARDPKTLRSVFASMHGDLAITDYMCSTLAADPSLVSPTRFHNSVHNAAAGYWSIGTGSTRPYTALSAGNHSFAAGLLESLLQLAGSREDVLFVSYDIEARGALASVAPSRDMLSVALVLATERGDRSFAVLDWDFVRGPAVNPSVARPGNAALVAGNANEHCLPLFEALASGDETEVITFPAPGLGLRLRVEPVRA